MPSHVALCSRLAARHGLRLPIARLCLRSLIFARNFIASPEQQAVVQHCQSHNVMVSARPGSGKTATAEALVRENPDVPIAVVTYSKRLQLATQQRLAEYPLAEAFTFHGLATRLFGEIVYNDTVLRHIRRGKAIPVWNMPDYRYVVLDELQDMTSDLYWLSCAFISALTRRSGTPPHLLILGDPHQAIYEFRGADARYLSLASTTFSALSPHPWESLKLAQSFRLSRQTSDFVNDVFLAGEPYIQGSHEGPRPIYVHADLSVTSTLIDLFLPLIRTYGPENTAILAPFVRNNPFLPQLTNTLSQRYSIPVAISTSDDISLDADVLNGKLAVSTYHQFKGSERDCVIVYGADASYFNFMGRDLPDDRCPNATFVALTRARKQLVVLQSHKFPAMPFVDWDAMTQHADYVDLADTSPRAQYEPGRPLQLGLLLPKDVFASEIARHVRDEELEELMRANVNIVELVGPTPYNDFEAVPDKVCTDPVKNHYEAVSDLNGLVVTAALEWSLQGKLDSFGYGRRKKSSASPPPDVPLDARQRAVWLMKEAVQYEARVSRYRSRLVQMKDHSFDWFAVDDGRLLELAVKRLRAEVLGDAVTTDALNFEHPMSFRVKIDGEETKLAGRADLLFSETKGSEVHTTIWEVKFVSALSQEHVAQAVAYAYLWWSTSRPKSRSKRNAPIVHFPRIVLFNVRTGAKWEIQTTVDRARSLIEGILRAKYTSKGESSLEEFITTCMRVVKAVESRQTSDETLSAT